MWQTPTQVCIKFTEKKVTDFAKRLEFKKGFTAEEVWAILEEEKNCKPGALHSTLHMNSVKWW